MSLEDLNSSDNKYQIIIYLFNMKSIVCFMVGWLLWNEAISQPLNWINKAEGNGEENITAQCFLPDNYFVIAGIFEKKNGINLQSANGKQFSIRTEDTKINEQVFLNNFFLAKYSDRGNLIWALNSTGYNNAYPYDVHWPFARIIKMKRDCL